MPAIQPTRLKQQAAVLADSFTNPPAYVRGLHDLLDFYADRAHRPGQSGIPASLTTAYKVRQPVLRHILQEIIPLAVQNPRAGLTLCDALWAEPYLEFRLLCSQLMGQIPVSEPEMIIERLNAWLKSDLDPHLINALLENSLAYLRQHYPQTMVKLAQNWLDRSNIFYQQLGLRTLLPMAKDPAFENLPAFFRLVHPLVRKAPIGLRPDLLDIIEALARRSPTETAFFLRQTLALPNSPDAPWVLRQVLIQFPPEMQKNLRAHLRGQEKQE